MTNIIGIAIRGHDQGACLIQNGKLKYCVEEEKLERFKHGSTNPHHAGIPVMSIDWVLSEAGLTMKDIDKITVPMKPSDEFKKLPTAVMSTPGFYFGGGIWGGGLIGPIFKFGALNKNVMKTGERFIEKHYDYLPPVEYIEHHTAHSASTFRCSGFKKANILTMDGIGGLTTISMKAGNGNEMETIKEITFPHSLGALYGDTTKLLGFKSGDEGKVMALASFGTPNGTQIFDNAVTTSKGDFRLDFNKINTAYNDAKYMKWHEKATIARGLQDKLEECIFNLAEFMYEHTGYKNFCLAGGVALNAVANGKLLQKDYVNDIFVQPGAGDNGAFLGAALEEANSRSLMVHPYWGPQYNNDFIQAELTECKHEYEYYNDKELVSVVADMLSKGDIIGWHHGREEFGPRALGARSIIANPGMHEMKDRINNEVKHREPWRPFAPSILKEDMSRYLMSPHDSRFMILSFDLTSAGRADLDAAKHVDNTVRPQTVTKEDNGLYYDMIRAFKKKTCISAVLNTSFNIAGEPIVCSPRDSIGTFSKTGLDALVLGNFVLRKKG